MRAQKSAEFACIKLQRIVKLSFLILLFCFFLLVSSLRAFLRCCLQRIASLQTRKHLSRAQQANNARDSLCKPSSAASAAAFVAAIPAALLVQLFANFVCLLPPQEANNARLRLARTKSCELRRRNEKRERRNAQALTKTSFLSSVQLLCGRHTSARSSGLRGARTDLETQLSLFALIVLRCDLLLCFRALLLPFCALLACFCARIRDCVRGIRLCFGTICLPLCLGRDLPLAKRLSNLLSLGFRERVAQNPSNANSFATKFNLAFARTKSANWPTNRAQLCCDVRRAN